MKGVPLLLEMLSYRRPASCRAEQKFINRFIRPAGAAPDAFGNLILRIGDAPVAWCSHTDTVHKQGGRQRVGTYGDVASAPDSDCLGADDTTGVWIMLEMIRAGVEGLYLFHRAEEVGCLGSEYIARHTPGVLDGIQFAIALDRRGDNSIVTHQLGRRTCSDTFSWSLAGQLGISGMHPDPNGVFTDTEVYADLIPECTNVSVGYARQHSPSETQDLTFAERILDALLGVDADALVSARVLGAECPGWGEYSRVSMFDDPGGAEWWDADSGTEWWDADSGTGQGYSLHLCDNCGVHVESTVAFLNGQVCPDCARDLFGSTD